LSSQGRAAWSLLLTAALALLSGGCESEYSLPPTACDDYCHATLRGNCADDAPADCVRDCEKANTATVRDRCAAAWRARDDCWLTAAPSAFSCQDKHSKIADICLDERRAFAECVSPGSGSCFDQCVRQAQACGSTLSDCEAGCSNPTPACRSASVAFNTCLLGYPVDCGNGSEPDTRDPAHTPCYYEALGVLACDK